MKCFAHGCAKMKKASGGVEWWECPRCQSVVDAIECDTRREDAAGERLAQIAARLNAATPGPWEHCHEIKSLGYIAILGQSQDNQQHYVRSTGGVVDDGARHDAEFIAHSRSDMEYLLAALSTAERERAELQFALEAIRSDIARSARPDDPAMVIFSVDVTARDALESLARVPSGGEEGR